MSVHLLGIDVPLQELRTQQLCPAAAATCSSKTLRYRLLQGPMRGVVAEQARAPSSDHQCVAYRWRNSEHIGLIFGDYIEEI